MARANKFGSKLLQGMRGIYLGSGMLPLTLSICRQAAMFCHMGETVLVTVLIPLVLAPTLFCLQLQINFSNSFLNLDPKNTIEKPIDTVI